MPRSICFVGHLMLPLLTGRDDPIAGGVEIQTYHLAEEMHRRGWEVSFLVCGMEGAQEEVLQTQLGRAHILYRPVAKPGVGRAWRNQWQVSRALRRVESELIFQRASWDAATCSTSARLAGKPYVYCLQSDREAVALGRFSKQRLVLNMATSVVTQSQSQRGLLERYGRESTVIPACFPIPGWDAHERNDILWLGTLRPLRGADIFLDLAEALPDQRFVICSSPADDPRLVARLQRRAERIANVRFEGFVPYARLPEHLMRARVLINTSRHEGFPSSFILAWLHGTVVVSLRVDPDGLLSGNGLGLVGRDPIELLRALERVLEDDATSNEIRARARTHAEIHHDVQRIGAAYEELFETLLTS